MTARREKQIKMFNLFLPKEQTARIVFVLKLIAIQDLLKGGKLSIIKNKMQKKFAPLR